MFHFYQKMTSSPVLKDAGLQLNASFAVDYCMLEWECETIHSQLLQVILSSSGKKEITFLHFCLPRYMSPVAEKKITKELFTTLWEG